MKVLLTGGAGFIGSHTAIELIKAGHEIVIVDNFVNSSRESIRRVEKITQSSIKVYDLDIRNKNGLNQVFTDEQIGAVIHFAGLKAVGESVEKPLMYYDNNINGTITLLETMAEHNVVKLVFSSSATVYGNAKPPYSEESPTGVGITNPYGQTKFMTEQIMKDIAKANPKVEFTALRYFNPVGAHESGMIGEDPNGIPNNLMPYISQVAAGKRAELSVFGDDYDTPDGTGVRDYIHVVDLALGHVAALEHSSLGFDAINLGSGKGTSVLELIKSFEKASGQNIPYKIAPRREGDLPTSFAKVEKAKHVLNWQASKTIDDMCRDSWKWQSKNPSGYSS